jgi:hypothetical protein
MRPFVTAALCLSATVVLPGFPAPPAGQSGDATAVLSAARAAMGGDAALDAISTLTVNGSWNMDLPPAPLSKSIDVSYQAPDRFMRVARRSMNVGPPGAMAQTFVITEYSGFNGATPIQDIHAPGAPFPVWIPGGPEPTTPADIAAARERTLRFAKMFYVRMMLPLFAASPPASPLTFTLEGQAPVGTAAADVVAARGADGEWKLFIDTVSRLPVKLTWQAHPIVTFSTSSIVTTNQRGDVLSQSPPQQPPPVPTTGLPLVEWATTISEYKKVDGLLWPHRMTTTVDGRKHEEMRFRRFRLNPDINPRTFEIRK